MEQDVNKVLTSLSNEWARDMAEAKRKIAILSDQNRLLQEEIAHLKEEKQENENPNTNA